MAMLGLLCCMWAFSNCGAQGLPFIMVLHWVLTAVVSPVAEHRLLHQGLSTYDLSCLVALQHMGPSRTRDHIHVPCTGRWTVYWLPGTPWVLISKESWELCGKERAGTGESSCSDSLLCILMLPAFMCNCWLRAPFHAFLYSLTYMFTQQGFTEQVCMGPAQL